MANTRIQIKRSQTTAAPSSGALYAGELAFSNASQTLYIGNPDAANTVTPIGTKLNWGTLTANAVLVTNSTSAIDSIKTGNLVFTGTSQNILANGSVGSSGWVLASGGSGSNVYWISSGALGVNTDAQYTWSNVHTFNANLIANNIYSTATVNASTLSVGTSVVGNSSGVFTTGTVNGAVVSVGTSFIANTTQVTLAQGMKLAANGSVGSANQVLRSDNSGTVYWSDDLGDISAVTAGDGLTGGGSSGDVTVDVGAGNGIEVNSTAVAVKAGNSGVISNSSGVYVNAATFSIATSQLSGDVALGTQTSGDYVASLSTGAGLSGSGSGEGSTPTIAVVANSGIVANSTGVFVNANNGLVSNSSGVFVVGSNGVVSNSSGVYLKTSSDFTVNTGGLYVNQAGSFTMQDLTLNGNLTVSGTLTTIDTTNLSVKDNMVILADQLASTSSFLDNVDTGWYVKSGNTGTNFSSGLARIAVSSTNTNPYFKLFSTTVTPNNTTIDTNATTGTLQAFLAPWGAGGGLVVNSTNISVTANGSVAVDITANTLALATALPATSGGTGWGSYTAGDLLYASNTSYLSKLGVGSDGQVLQISSTSLQWNGLDGGTF